jgi:hypothetical protein
MELVDMNSLGLFNFFILSVQVGFTLFLHNKISSINKKRLFKVLNTE